MSYAYWRLGDTEKAGDAVRQLVTAFPESPLSRGAPRRHARFTQALEGLHTALNILLEGKYRVLFDPSGRLTRRRIAEAYRLLAEIHLVQGNLPDALARLAK